MTGGFARTVGRHCRAKFVLPKENHVRMYAHARDDESGGASAFCPAKPRARCGDGLCPSADVRSLWLSSAGRLRVLSWLWHEFAGKMSRLRTESPCRMARLRLLWLSPRREGARVTSLPRSRRAKRGHHLAKRARAWSRCGCGRVACKGVSRGAESSSFRPRLHLDQLDASLDRRPSL